MNREFNNEREIKKIGISTNNEEIKNIVSNVFVQYEIEYVKLDVCASKIDKRISEYEFYINIDPEFTLVDGDVFHDNLNVMYEDTSIDIMFFSPYDDELSSVTNIDNDSMYLYYRTYYAKGFECAMFRGDVVNKGVVLTNCKKNDPRYNVFICACRSLSFSVVNPRNSSDFNKNNRYKQRMHQELEKLPVFLLGGLFATVFGGCFASIVKNSNKIL